MSRISWISSFVAGIDVASVDEVDEEEGTEFDSSSLEIVDFDEVVMLEQYILCISLIQKNLAVMQIHDHCWSVASMQIQ